MLNVKQGHTKYHFLSLWYDSTWDWTLISWTIDEHSTRLKLERFHASYQDSPVQSARGVEYTDCIYAEE